MDPSPPSITSGTCPRSERTSQQGSAAQHSSPEVASTRTGTETGTGGGAGTGTSVSELAELLLRKFEEDERMLRDIVSAMVQQRQRRTVNVYCA
jgi:uncharacterized spore protein YtfJ